MNGMTLEQLFIKVSSQYTGGSEMRRATSDVDRLERRTQALNKTLNVMTGALTAFSAASLAAFTSHDRALTEFAGKAGMARREFSAMFGEAGRAIVQATGVERAIIMSGQQQALSLGASVEQANRITSLAATLHSTNQAQLGEAVSSSIALAGMGLGDAEDLLQKIYAGSQAGAGNVPDYFLGAKSVAPLAQVAGVDVDEMIAALSVISASAKSFREGETQANAFFKALAKPSTTGAKAFQEITGQDYSVLQELAQGEGGLASVLTFIKENIPKERFADVFSEIESIKFLGGMLDNIKTLEANTLIIKNAPETDPIGMQASEALKDFSFSLRRLWGSIKELLIQFGEPLAKALKPVVDGLQALVVWLTKLDEDTNGLIAKMTGLLTGLLMLRLAVMALTPAIWALKAVLGISKVVGGGGVAGSAGRTAAGAAAGTAAGNAASSTAARTGLRQILGSALRAANPMTALIVGLLAAAGFTVHSLRDEEGISIGQAQGSRREGIEAGVPLDQLPDANPLDIAEDRRDKAKAYGDSLSRDLARDFSVIFKTVMTKAWELIPEYTRTQIAEETRWLADLLYEHTIGPVVKAYNDFMELGVIDYFKYLLALNDAHQEIENNRGKRMVSDFFKFMGWGEGTSEESEARGEASARAEANPDQLQIDYGRFRAADLASYGVNLENVELPTFRGGATSDGPGVSTTINFNQVNHNTVNAESANADEVVEKLEAKQLQRDEDAIREIYQNHEAWAR